MSDDERVPSAAQDVRVKFVEEKVCGLLRLQRHTWEKSFADERFQAFLQVFFEKGSVVFFWLSNKGCLLASDEVQSVAHKRIYILKRTVVPVSDENYRELLLFGLLSASPLLQLSSTVKQLCAPLLSNHKNHQMWPNLMSEDVIRHTERMCSKTSVVQGQVIGETVLPIPTETDWIDNSYSSLKMYNTYDRVLAHAIETQVINWTNLIQKILKEDSSDWIPKASCNPGPSAELKFWASRASNIKHIYLQLQSPIVQKMAEMLEMMDSSYHPAIKMLIENVVDALQEAQDIDIHLQPLHAQLSHLEKQAFPLFETFLPALIHTVFLLWTNCKSYQRPARIVVLLQEICNLLIEQASTYLSADHLFREDPEESLQMVRRVIQVFRCFRDSYQTQRERLANHVKHAPWDFPSAMIFARFNQFLNRMLQLEDLFEIMLDIRRMEKLEFGGPKGKLYSEHAAQMYSEFITHCQALQHSENNPLDIDTEDFEKDYKEFKVRTVDFECCFASLLCLAFKDCSGLESVFKLLTIVGPFLERKQILQIFSHNFFLLQQHFREELETCNILFKKQLNQVWKEMFKTQYIF